MDAVFPSVSVCLLNYNGSSFLERCVDALERLDPPPSEILVVDNASTDGSVALLARLALRPGRIPLRVLPAGTNRGYAGGHNLAARNASGEYLAFLNVTVTVEPGWLEVVRWMHGTPDVAFAQPAIFHTADPTRLESLGTLLTPSGDLRVVGRDRREGERAGPPYVAEVLSVLGAAFVARRVVFEALGGFDERMFMYFEETDLCWRGWLAGHRSVCWFDPARPTRAFHAFHGTHPPGFDVARYFEPNRTLTLFRNLETRNLWHLGRNVATVASESIRTPRRFLRYLAAVGARLPAAAHERRRIQSTRLTPDRRLFTLTVPPEVERRFSPGVRRVGETV